MATVERWREQASGLLYRGDYNATPSDSHYGATEPLEAESCRCESPLGLVDELGETRCLKCGKPERPTHVRRRSVRPA